MIVDLLGTLFCPGIICDGICTIASSIFHGSIEEQSGFPVLDDFVSSLKAPVLF